MIKLLASLVVWWKTLPTSHPANPDMPGSRTCKWKIVTYTDTENLPETRVNHPAFTEFDENLKLLKINTDNRFMRFLGKVTSSKVPASTIINGRIEIPLTFNSWEEAKRHAEEMKLDHFYMISC